MTKSTAQINQARRAGYKVPRAHATKLDADIAESLIKKEYDWNSFIDGAAFAFWASPYMSEVENLYEDSRSQEDPKKAAALEEAYRALSPGPGGRWESVLPETPPSARAVAKKFTKAVKDKLSNEELSEVAAKFSAYDAGYYGAMQSQGEGVGWFDEGVRVNPPRGFEWDTKIHNAIFTAIRRGAREAGVRLPR